MLTQKIQRMNRKRSIRRSMSKTKRREIRLREVGKVL